VPPAPSSTDPAAARRPGTQTTGQLSTGQALVAREPIRGFTLRIRRLEVNTMTGFGVVTGELHAAQVVLDSAAEAGHAELTRLRAAAQDLLRGGWQGDASTAFGRGWQEWLDGALLVLTALEQTSRVLDLTGREYAGAEGAVRVDLDRIAS
jgi:WXG100 family type VII secretion target